MKDRPARRRFRLGETMLATATLMRRSVVRGFHTHVRGVTNKYEADGASHGLALCDADGGTLATTLRP